MVATDANRPPGVAGECARLIGEIDWSTTALGPVAGWSATLRATVRNVLHSRQAMLLFWGPDLVQLYNDSFVPSFGQGKHPAAMGQPARECWAEAWPVIGAQIEAVMSRGEPAWHEDALVPIDRNGRMEEVFWTYSYSPAFDDDGSIAGTLVIVTETTGKVLAARRLAALAALGAALASATERDQVWQALEALVAGSRQDVPFALVLARGGEIRRTIGVDPAALGGLGPAGGGPVVELERGIAGAVWPEPVTRVLLASSGDLAFGFGVSPRLPLDDAYRSYLAQIGEQLAAALQRIDVALASRAIIEQRDSLLLQAPIGTALMSGPTHVFLLANQRYCQIVGRDPTGRPLLEAFPELVGSPTAALLDRVYQEGEPFLAYEQLMRLDRTGSGIVEDCYFNFNVEPLRDPAGSVHGMMAVLVDITEQVRARRALEKIDAERAAALSELERASRAKDEFLAMLGHELRNPLAPIASAVELMKSKDGGSSRERDTIERQLQHVVRLVDDLLDVSRITRGKIDLQKQVVDVSEAIADAVESAAPLIERRAHRLVRSVDEGLYVHADQARLSQVMVNLLTNAARYTQPGGEIRVSARAEAERVVIRVTDTGIGMEPDLVARVFDLFVQGSRPPDRTEGGLGLGLALVKNIVALHGGTVAAHSDGPGAGSAFTVSLARHQPPSTDADAGPAPAAVRTGGSKRVLIVDDNEDAAVLLGELVRISGHEILIAHDPSAALRAMSEFCPDIAVLDIGLPGMDGYDLAARVRELSRHCRLIALTGYGQDRDRERAAAAGFDAHFVKPVAIEVFLRAIDGEPTAGDLSGRS
jgi:signal transduction histidine kinase/CheY-like chemotaxis protein